MDDLVLWGASGHGKVALGIARAVGEFKAISFIDDACEESAREFCGCPVLGVGRYLGLLKGKGSAQFLVSIGKNEIRAACFERAHGHGLLPATLLHPSAVVTEVGPN